MSPQLQIDRERIATFCKSHHIRKLSLFGSVLRDDFRPDSDVDVLVEFEPGKEPGYIGLSSMERELSNIIGHQADLRTPEDLSRLFRSEVIEGSEIQFAS